MPLAYIAPVAQRIEQLGSNQLVGGSIPSRGTISIMGPTKYIIFSFFVTFGLLLI